MIQKKQKQFRGILREKEETAVQETLKICKILADNGVQLDKLQLSWTDKNDNKKHYIKLKHIKGIEKLIRKYDWDENLPIGRRLQIIRNKGEEGEAELTITKEDMKEAKNIPRANKHKRRDGDTRSLKGMQVAS